MMHLIRTSLSRDLGAMGNVDLYRHSYTGTKDLIERYVSSALETIEAIVTRSGYDKSIETKDLLEGVIFSRQSFGRSALLLSGGGGYGMTHVGVLKTLFEANLLPRIVSGASAGSIVCAVMCTRTDEEMPALIRDFPYGDNAVFGAEGTQDGVLEHMHRLLTKGSWSDIKHLAKMTRNMTGDLTFQEAYNRTRRILNICVSTSSVYELPRLLNYVTAPNVMIWSAVAASCSVPLVFNSCPLLVKDPATGEHRSWIPTPQYFIDGSVDNDLPMTRLAEMFNVNHFIVSQVNPHVVPFLSKDDHLSPENSNLNRRDETPASRDSFDWTYSLTNLARDEALHRFHVMAELGIFPNLVTKCMGILSQKYSGDINILPDISMQDLPFLLSNPTSDFILRSCLLGEKATWPKLSRIRDRCAIELALDRAVHRLRTRVVFSQSQRDLRNLSSSVGNLRLEMPTSTAAVTVARAEPADAAGDSATHATIGPPYKRHRRRSGGSLRHPVDRKSLLLLSAELTDDDTAEEEEREFRLRNDARRGTSPAAQRKPVRALMRVSKSHVNMQAHRGALSPAPIPETRGISGFDFAQPMTPPVFHEKTGDHKEQSTAHAGGDADLRMGEESVQSTDDSVPFSSPNLWSDAAPQSRGGTAVFPTNEVETSATEQGNSSDADCEQDTGESDADGYKSGPTIMVRKPSSQDVPSPPTAVPETFAGDREMMFGPEGRLSGMWE